MTENDKSSLLKKAEEQVTQVKTEASRLKNAASQAIEDTVTEAKRLAKRSRYVAEDLVDDAAHRIKRDPLRSVGIGFALGLSIGIVSGWLAIRNTKV